MFIGKNIMKKSTFLIASSALLAFGLSQTTTTFASTSKTLTSNAYIYDAKGKKITRLGKLLKEESKDAFNS